MGALDASLGMKAQLALGRSWPLASHLPGAPASGLTEKAHMDVDHVDCAIEQG